MIPNWAISWSKIEGQLSGLIFGKPVRQLREDVPLSRDLLRLPGNVFAAALRPGVDETNDVATRWKR
jgi:hypothetical protein